MKALNQWYINILLVVLSVATVCIFLLFRNKTYYDFLLWNLFLAWIPYVISLFAYYVHTRKATLFHHALLVILGVVWLLFLPNAPYLITDLLHLTILKDNYVHKGAVSFKYWYDFFVAFLFVWNGLLLGCSSMYLSHYMWRKKFNRLSSWMFITAIALLSGYGILLGREYRLNSWDALMNRSYWM
ncbi:DUF1361 domain-containing protein [Paenibacillus sp. N3.4]|uniref:DUF1361 domain-containing protein n=1 Tax=Paenibacillus sp. N3.4 TaxID=2603222 RepID=UPI0011CBC888|nr:DUF1361 domain-containing protein [Paenibacillus sp. N3.4]TXK72782.1 DUF1361 domain-containing protein [Paenibacillus sp. N3.4]